MRARDAYLAELERALLASTTQLEASGIGTIEDAHKLLGRLRGQASRLERHFAAQAEQLAFQRTGRRA